MTHDGGWRAACRNRVSSPSFRSSHREGVRSVTDPGVGSSALLARLIAKVLSPPRWRHWVHAPVAATSHDPQKVKTRTIDLSPARHACGLFYVLVSTSD